MIGIIAIKQSLNPITRYGYLYNREVVNNIKGLIDGYHIPSEIEINTLITYLGGTSSANLSLRQKGGSSWGYPNYATNSSGFNALGGGYRDNGGGYNDITNKGVFWGSTINGGQTSLNYCLNLTNGSANIELYDKLYGLSIRLIKNDSTWVSGETESDYDGNIYNTIKIGNQVWLTSDLKTTHFKDGTLIEHITSSSDWGYYLSTTSKYCIYGEIDATIPIITTDKIIRLTKFTASCLNTLVSFGGNISGRGVCWNTTGSPTVNDQKSSDSFYDLGQVNSVMNGLSSDTLYYVRSYVISDTGTVYGKELLMKTWYSEVTDHNLINYNTVMIGNNEWMASNLRCPKFKDKDILGVGGSTEWVSYNKASWCDYNNSVGGVNENNWDYPYRVTNGILYNGYVPISSVVITNDQDRLRNVAPPNWHIATDQDWSELLGEINNNKTQIMEYGNYNWVNNDINGTDYNKKGLSFVGTGYRSSIGEFLGVNEYSSYWTSYIYPNNQVGCYHINMSSQYIQRTTAHVSSGFNIRCVKNKLPTIEIISISNITDNSANITSDFLYIGSSLVTTIGICYSYSPTPTINNTKTINQNNNFGLFTNTIGGLLTYSTIHVRAYATNSYGTVYSKELVFRTEWSKDEKLYGYLYNYSAASRLAPPGWRLPTKSDFDILNTSASELTKNLAISGGYDWIEENQNNTYNNSTNFSAYPGGKLQPLVYGEIYELNISYGSYLSIDWIETYFRYIRLVTIFWSSTYDNNNDSSWDNTKYSSSMYVLLLTTYLSSSIVTSSFNTSGYHGYDGYSVRLIKNDSIDPGVVSIDNVNYDTVRIGSQVWTKTNLYARHLNDGSSIQICEDSAEWYDLSMGSTHPPLYTEYPTRYSKNVIDDSVGYITLEIDLSGS